MSVLEIIIYSLIGLAVAFYLFHRMFIKPRKKEKQQNKPNNDTSEKD